MNSLISIFIGFMVSLMIMINGNLSNSAGSYTSIVIIHIVGLIVTILILIVTKSKLQYHKGIPIYLYSAGAIGVFTVLFNNLSFLALGVSIPLALGLLGQSITSMIIDQFGLLGMKIVKFKKEKIIGLAFITLGIVIMMLF
jgi:transporter family-2 protein